MASVDRILLSGSTRGQPIKVVATATAGTTIHTTGTSATIQDELWLWACNTDTSDRKLTIEFGGVTAPDNLIEVTLPAEGGLQTVIPGLFLVGTGGAGSVVGAFAAAANVVLICGWVYRVT